MKFNYIYSYILLHFENSSFSLLRCLVNDKARVFFTLFSILGSADADKVQKNEKKQKRWPCRQYPHSKFNENYKITKLLQKIYLCYLGRRTFDCSKERSTILF